VAIAASELVEREAGKRILMDSQKFEEQAEEIAKASSRAVSRNLWGDNHSVEVFDEALLTNFAQRLLRENLLHELAFEPVENTGRVVKVKHLFEYTAFNPSSYPSPYDLVWAMDDVEALYPNDPLLKRPKMTSVKIGEKSFTRQELDTLNEEMFVSRDPTGLTGQPVPIGSLKLGAGERVRVRFAWEGNEPIVSHWLQQIFVPTKGVNVVIQNKVGPRFQAFAMPLFREGFSARDNIFDDGSQWEVRYDGVVLPYSGWLIEWNDRAGANPPGQVP
jgi:hypothetical protein